jgi:hypothetical protein
MVVAALHTNDHGFAQTVSPLQHLQPQCYSMEWLPPTPDDVPDPCLVPTCPPLQGDYCRQMEEMLVAVTELQQAQLHSVDHMLQVGEGGEGAGCCQPDADTLLSVCVSVLEHECSG